MNLTGLEHLITVDPDIVWGTPVFRGTRVPIKALFDHLEGSTLEEFLSGYPSVTREHAEAVIHAIAERAISALAA